MSRPLDRTCMLPQIGEVDEEAGEFWVPNPFMMPQFGHNLSAFERNRLYLNLEGRAFMDASRFSAVDLDADSRSVVAADFNRDGWTDLLVGSVGGGPLRLFLNRMPRAGKHFVKLELIGTDSNRTAIGTRCEIRCGENLIVRDAFAANGCMGQGPPEIVAGIGTADRIDSLKIRWPSGKIQEFENIPSGSSIRIEEGAEKFEVQVH